ncbi:MAG TPA: ankyrin repeat domain-containing protein [Burkholderiales bacterium]|nr:ankyrin repeat domain-containing protein [Burkholderiales bacterium]
MKPWKTILVLLSAVIIGLGAWLIIDQRRQVGEYELMAAAAQGDTSRIRQLAARVDVNARFGGDGETALHRAAARGHLSAVRLLVDLGANVNAVDEEGATPLLAATYRGQKEVVALLLSKGASVNAQERRHGFTPLIQAVARSNEDLVKILLDHHADASLKTVDGRTALDWAQAGGAPKIVALLKAAADKK